MSANQDVLDRLRSGNEQYVKNGTYNGDVSAARRLLNVKNGQHPYAVVLACADSRMIPEAAFSAGVGDLFTIRLAGNVVGETQLGSVEYAVEHLHVKVIVVLGHTNCGAVGAALEGGAGGYVAAITDRITEVIGNEKDSYKAACMNARHWAQYLKNRLDGHNGIRVADLDIVPAMFDLESGRVEWL